MLPRSSRRLSLQASLFLLALILSALLLACGGEVVEQNGSGQGTRPAETRVEEGTPTATGSTPTGAAASTPQSGSTSTAGGQAEEGTPTATRAASAGAAASTPGVRTEVPTPTTAPPEPTLAPTESPTPTTAPPEPTHAPTESPTPTTAPPEPTLAPTESPTPTTAPPEPTATPRPTPRPTPTPTPAGPWSLEGGTPLHQAVFDGDLAKVEELLNQGADVNVGGAVVENDEDAVVWNDVSPLHLAAFNSDLAAAAMLLDWGADLERGSLVQGDSDFNDHLLTPLFVAVRYNEDAELVTLLLNRGANSEPAAFFRYGGSSSVTPLYWALRHHADPTVAALLLEGGASIDTLHDIQIPSWSEEGRHTGIQVKPLHLAAFNPDPEAVTLLLEWGADVNEWWLYGGAAPTEMATLIARAQVGDISGITPLQLAAAFNPNPEVTDTLLRRGAGLGGFMESFEDAHYFSEQVPSIRPPIHWALRYNSNLAVAELLLEPGESLDDQGYQGTALHFAVRYGNSEITEALLDQGADAKATDSESNTPCQLARDRGRFTGTPLLGRLCRP